MSNHVFYLSTEAAGVEPVFPNFHVRELYYNGKWWGNDLTADTNGPLALNYPLTSFFVPS